MYESRSRVHIFIGVILTVLFILSLRLVKLQILDSDTYVQERAVREMRVFPARGVIYDRTDRMMVDNEPSYIITFTPYLMDRKQDGLLAELLGEPDSLVSAKIEEAKKWSPFLPSAAFREVPFARFSQVLENSHLLPGVSHDIVYKRRYQTQARASHALGYVREINNRTLEQRRKEGYRQGDLIGTNGLEKYYEDVLRGNFGHEYKFMNVRGQVVESYRQGQEDEPPTSGMNLHLTIDAHVQALAESLFVNKRGAAVAMDVNTGGLIALVSAPDYDPEIFAKSVPQDLWNYLTLSEDKPLFNRATSSGLMPGSTWKPFMSLMALQEGIFGAEELVNCPGGHRVGNRFFKCHGGVHGNITMRTAIQKSCNTYFYKAILATDVDTFHEYATMFGLGQRIPVDLTEQAPGLIPDSTYYNNRYPDGWGPGYSVNLGIGQGDMLVTPLQLARYIGAVANSGTLHTPHLVRELRHPETGEIRPAEVPPAVPIPIDREHFDVVREGMRLVMEAGTGRGVQLPGITSGGKTGTAQNPHGKDHSLFVMFAPYDNPQISIAVLVENGGFGATQAAPIASLMAEQYLTGQVSPQRLYLIDRLMRLSSEAIQ